MSQIVTAYTFPFGEKVHLVQQQARTPKRVFVLGVYASAVHARWVDPEGKTVVTALAVASEPYIFWRGDNAEAIINQINVPDGLGNLIPAARNLNGPSGKTLDERLLEPLRLNRDDVWLCDLVPHSCLNPGQKKALARAYEPLAQAYKLPAVTLPPVPTPLADDTRRAEILMELRESQADTIMLLGDEPIKWFLHAFDNSRKTLSAFGTDESAYGHLHFIDIAGKRYQVLPLVHPRQAGRLGAHSEKWSTLHTYWINNTAQSLTL